MSSSNWHWVQRDCSKWSHSWIKTELAALVVTSEGLTVRVDAVDSVEGDVTVGRRKSKLITIYDLDISLKWSAKVADGTELTGVLRVPEMSHEAFDGLTDYVFDFSSPASSSPSFLLVKASLPPALKEKFAAYQTALLEAHGKDLLAQESAPASGSITPAKGVAASDLASAVPSSVDKNKPLNTSTVQVSTHLRASAQDVWSLLTDERKIPTWSRSAAQFSATPSAPFSLFSGAVHGEVLKATPPREIQMTWALRSVPSWPKGHFGVLFISIEQQSDTTKVLFKLDGVPKGLETELENNLTAFYIRGFTAIGLSSDLSSAMGI